MDDSLSSPMDKALSFTEGSASAEESGWTAYFDDFFASQKREQTNGNGSMISDAASCVAWTLPAVTDASKSRKKLSFRKRKSRQVVDDDPLEDTASSPANSPKVLQGKGVEDFTDQVRKDGMDDQLGFSESVNGCTNLKEKGLCLVPLSILVDYLA